MTDSFLKSGHCRGGIILAGLCYGLLELYYRILLKLSLDAANVVVADRKNFRGIILAQTANDFSLTHILYDFKEVLEQLLMIFRVTNR